MSALEFNEEILRLMSTLERFTLKFTRNQEEAKDLVQDTLVKALSNYHRFQQNTNIKAWLFTIMRNTFINDYHKNIKIKSVVSLNYNVQELQHVNHDFAPSPEKELEHDDIQNGINNLKEDLKAPLELYRKGYKYKEIAEMLDAPIGTIKFRIHQAREILKESLKVYLV